MIFYAVLYCAFYFFYGMNPDFREPPGPWEEINTILTADFIVVAEQIDTTIVEIFNPYLQFMEKRVVAKVKIKKTLANNADHVLDKGTEIDILLPSLIDFGEEPENFEATIISFPSLFQENKCYIAAIKMNDDQYTGNSNYAHFSFFELNKDNLSKIEKLESRCPIKVEMARRISCRYLYNRDNCNNLLLDIVGLSEDKDQLRYVSNKDDIQSAKLYWNIRELNPGGKNIYINVLTSEVHEF